MKCACGCGKEPKLAGSVFCSGHNLRVRNPMDNSETVEKMSRSLKGRTTWNKGLTKETDKRLEKTSKAHKGKTTSERGHKPDCMCTVCRATRHDHGWMTVKVIDKMSKTLEQVWSNPEMRKKQSERHKGKRYHKQNCRCTFCKQERSDSSWLTEEIIQKRINTRKKKIEENPEKWHEHYVNMGFLSAESRRSNCPYIWNCVHFMSKTEMECAKLLLTTPIDGVNCNIYIGRKIIDFFPQEQDKLHQGKFVEFHPWDTKRTTEEYYKQRKEIIENSKFKGTNLVVIASLNELKR